MHTFWLYFLSYTKVNILDFIEKN